MVTLFKKHLYLSSVWQGLVVKNGHPKDIMCYDEIGLCAQNIDTILCSKVHTSGRPHVFI